MLNSINRHKWGAWAVAVGLCLATAGHAADRVVRALNMTVARGQTNTVTVVLSSLGDENGLGFSLQFDTNHLAYVSAKRGTQGTNHSATLNVNANATHLALGRVGFGLALPANSAFTAGSNEMIVVSFRALADGPTVSTLVRFFDLPIPRETVDAEVNTLDATYIDATVTVQGTCTYALATNSAGFASGSGSGQVSLTAGNGCAWTVSNTNAWITLTSPSSGSSSAVVTYAVQANPGASLRSGVVVIAGLPFTVTQGGAVCAYTLSPTSRTNGHGATTGLVNVAAGPGCAWNVVNSQSWISFFGPTSGTGDGSVSYALSANTNSADRTAVLVIGGASFALTQRGVPCEISLSPTNRTHGYSAATGAVSVTAISGCYWGVTNSHPWISILSSLTNSGSGTLTYAVESNLSSVSRTGVVMIADQVLTLIQQASSCTYRLSPTNRQHGYGLATNSFSIQTAVECAWQIINPNSWITLLTPVQSQGSATVTYTVAANPFIVGRTGVVSVAGETFTVSQLPASCNYVLTPKSAEHASGAETGLITVTAPAGCTWTVTGTATWVTNAPVTLPNSGMALWLRADAGATGSPISQWLDQSGNNRHASQASSTSQPTLRTSAINGLPAVRFDGVNDFLTFNLPVNGLSGMSVFLVTANTQNQNGGSVEAERAALFWNETAAWGTVYVSPFQSAINLRFGTTQANNRTIYSRPASVGNTFTLTEAIKNGATDSLYVNGTLVNSQGGKLSTIAGCRDIGNLARGYNDNTYFAGDIAEVVIYNRALSAAERATVEQILGQKYGLPTPGGAPAVPVPTGPNWWVTLTTAASGTGNGTVGYAVAANTNAASRTATLTIGDETFDIAQAAFGTSCIFRLSTTNRVHGNAGATNTVTLTAGSACNWSVFNTNAWITFALPTNGTGGATLTYSVAANTLPMPRTGLVRIADQVLILTQLEAACYRLSPTNRSHGYGVATNSFTVQAGLTCSWDVVNTNSWIAILSTPSGSGTSVVSYAVSANPTALSRTGMIVVEDKTFVITQGAAPCNSTLTPSSGNHGSGAETGLVTVTSPAGCLWTVVNTNPWIRLTTSDLGIGSGSFGYAVESNLAATARSGVITVNGTNLNVTQAGDSRICTYKLSTTNRIHGPAAATNTITLTTSNNCAWTLANGNSWITFQPPSSGTGAITHQYSVSANSNATWRTGLVYLADQILTIAQQPGGCTIRLSPTNRAHGYGPATNSFSVQTANGCTWTVTNTVDWIVLISPTNGIGPDAVDYILKANSSTSARTGLVYLADQVFTLVQAGAPCELSISPSSTSRGFGASTGLVSVTAPLGCAWTVVNTNQWLEVTPMSGSGDASVTYRVSANSNAVSRTGTVHINGEALVVTQAGTVLDCTARISPTNRVHGAGAATNSVTVTVDEGCTWTASESGDWLTLTSSGGSGTMTLVYTLAANPTFLERTSVVQIAGQALTVVQHAASCSSSLTPTSRTHGFSGGTNTIDLTILASCSWSIVNTNPWISFAAPLSGIGSATLSYTVASNAATTWRTGIVVVAGETLTLTQRPVQCEFELSPVTRTHGPGSATGAVSVTTLAICSWTATTTNGWIHPLTGASGAGAGTVTYSVDANPAAFERIGALLVGDQSLNLTQRAAVCSFSLAPTSQAHGAGAETGTVSVSSPLSCDWTVHTTNAWITLQSPTNGSGSGSVSYAVSANPAGSPRSGTLTIAGQSYAVTQAAAPCNFTLAPTNAVHGAAGGSGQIAISTLTGCEWTVENTNNWITLGTPDGSGNGSLTYTVAENTNLTARSGSLIVGGRRFVVLQSGTSCPFTLAPSNWVHRTAAGTGVVNVITAEGCGWTVINSNTWLTITSATNGVGSGEVAYTLTANSSANNRTGVVRIAELNYIVTQVGTSCTYRMSPTNRFHGVSATSNTVSVIVGDGCAWTALVTNDWITLRSGLSGSGNGTISYAISSNLAPTHRTGSITVGGESFNFTQWGTNCGLVLASSARGHGSGSETGLVSFTMSLSSCSWNAVASDSWITFSTAISGQGTGSLGYRVAANPTALARTGQVTVGGEVYSITQESGAPCQVTASPTNTSHGFAAATGTVAITALANCAWTVSETNTWITLLAPTSGTANGTVTYTLAANASPQPRSGIIFIDGTIVTVTQAGAACTFSVSPSNRVHIANGESSSISVTALPGCDWAVTNTNTWVQILSGSSGTGSGVITYSVSANPTTSTRAGVLFVGGQPFTLSQAGQVGRMLRAVDVNITRGQNGTLLVVLDSLGNENALGFSLCFNSADLVFVSARRGVAATNAAATLNVNSNQAPQGRLGLALALPSNEVLPGGSNPLVEVTFRATAGFSTNTTVALCDTPIPREPIDIDANELSATYGDATVTLNGKFSQRTYAITPTRRAHGPVASADTVAVTGIAGCPWNVVNTNDWFFVVGGESGRGDGEVSYVVDANPAALYRTGLVAIAGQTFTVTQDPAPRTFALTWTNGQHTANPETGTVLVTSPTGCSWTAINTNPWITLVAGTNGSGRGTVTYMVSANPSPIQRAGALSIGGESIFISQAGIACTHTLTPASRVHGMGTESGLISVITSSTCPWATVNTNSWIQIKAGLTGVGNGTVKYSVLDNPNPSTRTATFTVGDQVFTVIQFGAPCSYTLLPTNRVHGSGGGTSTVSVLTVDECTWGVVNTNAWIGIVGATNGAGSATVTYSMAPNPLPNDRAGTMTIAGQTFGFIQLGSACAFSVGPTNQFFHGSGAETGMVQVTSYSGCIWTASRTNTWVTLGSTGGTGDGALAYTVAPNPTALTRTTVLTIAGAAVRITQAPAPCTYGLAPTTLAHGPLQGTGIVSVLTLTGCTWTVSQTNPWITLLSNTNGSNGVNVSYRVLANPTAIGRTGMVFVADLPLTVSQAGANCTYSLSPTNRSVAFSGGTGMVSVAAIPGCVWSVVTTSSWLTITSPTSFVGSNSVTYTVDPNPMGVSRTNVVVIAGLAHTITQAGAPCVFTLTPSTRMHGPLAETNSVTLNSLVGCPWTVVNTNGWISILSGTNGNGPGPVTYVLAANSALVSRVGTVVIAGQPFTITNLGAFLTCPPNRTYECGTAWTFEPPAVLGACGGTNIDLRIVSTLTNTVCGNAFTAIRTWEATDNCGNRVTCSQSVNVVITNAPVLACAANRTVEAGTAWTFDFPTAIGSCGQTVTLNIIATTTNRAGACGAGFSANRQWEAVDACGNRSVCSQTITVVDTTPPVLTCAPNKTIACGNAWTFDPPTALDAGDGTNVNVTVLGTVTNGVCGAAFSAQRIWQAEDRCGNRVTCSQTVFNRQVTVAGAVYYATNYPSVGLTAKRVAGAALALSGSSETTNRTSADGSYGFNLYGGGNFTITPGAPTNEPPAQGVSTVDISLIRRHILNMAILDSPYKLLAADVNVSRSITTLDVSYIRRLVLDATNTLPGGLWRFVPADYAFPTPTAPWDAPTNRVYPNLASNLTGQDFVAVKLGDVNNSWTAAAAAALGEAGFQPASESNVGALANANLPRVTFSASAHTNRPGATLAVQVRVSDFRDVTSAQFTLEWDPVVLRFNAVGAFALGGLGDGNFGLVATNQGRLAFSWDDPGATGATVADGTAIFTVTFSIVGLSGTESLLRFSDLAPEREVAVNFSAATFVPVDGWVIVDDPTAPSLASPAYGPGGFGVRVQTLRGRSYILEYTDSLSTTVWRALPAVSGDGTMKVLSDPSPSSAQRFYRVRTE